MVRGRVELQERDVHALAANRRQLQDERDKKIGSMRADIQALADRIAVEEQSLREHQSKRSEIQGEVQILNAKLESNKGCVPAAIRCCLCNLFLTACAASCWNSSLRASASASCWQI